MKIVWEEVKEVDPEWVNQRSGGEILLKSFGCKIYSKL